MPEIPNETLVKIIKERIDKWDELLLEQMSHLSVIYSQYVIKKLSS